MENLEGGTNMEKDTLTYVEAPVTQASDTDPGTATGLATAPPDIQTPLEGASSEVNVGQKSPGPGENEETENMSALISSPSAEANGQCPEAGPVDATVQGCNTQGDARRKGSQKRRSRKQIKIVYLPWPLTLQTRASSAAPVLCRSQVLGPLVSADPGDSEAGADREQGEGDEQSEKASTLAEPQEEPADALRPAAIAVQPSLEESPLAANKGLKMRHKKSRKGRNKKNKKIMANPWPLKVPAWSSCIDLAQAQSGSAGEESVAGEGVDGGHGSQGPERVAGNESAETPWETAQEEASDSAEDLEQGLWAEGESLSADGVGGGGTSGHADSKRKEKGVLARPWPLTVQAWVSFRAKDEFRTPLRKQSSAARMGVDVGQKKQPQPETSEGETKSPRPVSKAEQAPETGQGRRSTERRQAGQNFWKCKVRNFARQVDHCYCGDRCSLERREALTLTRDHTHIGTSVMGMQAGERERTETQAVCMGKWGGF